MEGGIKKIEETLITLPIVCYSMRGNFGDNYLWFLSYFYFFLSVHVCIVWEGDYAGATEPPRGGRFTCPKTAPF